MERFYTSADRADLVRMGETFRKTARIVAIRQDGPFDVQTEHGRMLGAAGDWLATNHPDDAASSDVWPISAARFAASYDADDGIPRVPATPLTLARALAEHYPDPDETYSRILAAVGGGGAGADDSDLDGLDKGQLLAELVRAERRRNEIAAEGLDLQRRATRMLRESNDRQREVADAMLAEPAPEKEQVALPPIVVAREHIAAAIAELRGGDQRAGSYTRLRVGPALTKLEEAAVWLENA